MTTYLVTGRINEVTLTQAITVETELSPEDEIQHAEDTVLDGWEKFVDINLLDEVTTEGVKSDE